MHELMYAGIQQIVAQSRDLWFVQDNPWIVQIRVAHNIQYR